MSPCFQTPIGKLKVMSNWVSFDELVFGNVSASTVECLISFKTKTEEKIGKKLRICLLYIKLRYPSTVIIMISQSQKYVDRP